MSSDEGTGKGLLVKADVIANTFRSEVKDSLSSLFSSPPSSSSSSVSATPQNPTKRKIKLVGILSTSSAPSRSYAQFTKKQCDEFGIEFVLKETGAAINGGEGLGLGEGEGVEEAIIEANEDENIDGIMVRGIPSSQESEKWSIGTYRCTIRSSVCSRCVYALLQHPVYNLKGAATGSLSTTSEQMSLPWMTTEVSKPNAAR